jgi:cytochrome oxidase Cu insertion factor (SCO1/SenC/PrrC family)
MRFALALLVLLATGAATPAAADKVLDDLLFELQLVPMNGVVAPPFELERLSDGKTTTLAEHRGRTVMLYFWATW